MTHKTLTEKLVLNECIGFWNVETADGYVCESFTDKRLARAYQRLMSRFELTNRQVWAILRRYRQTFRFVAVQ